MKNISLNDFIIVILDKLIFAQRIYHWMILLLHEEFIIERFYSYMKNFIIVTLDDLILTQRIYRWMILLLHEEFIIERFYPCMKSFIVEFFGTITS